jgi:hypothetical protein
MQEMELASADAEFRRDQCVKAVNQAT